LLHNPNDPKSIVELFKNDLGSVKQDLPVILVFEYIWTFTCLDFCLVAIKHESLASL